MENLDSPQLSYASKDFLSTIGKWSLFISIIGFVVTFFIIIFALIFFAVGTTMLSSIQKTGALANFGASAIGLVMLLTSLIYFLPSFFLFQYSRTVKYALANEDSESLEIALKQLKNYFTIIGSIIALIVGLYTLLIIGSMTIAMIGRN